LIAVASGCLGAPAIENCEIEASERTVPMAEERVERRLAAILAADVAGYSRLMGVNEEGTLTALKRQQSGVLLNALGMVIERRPAERSRWCGKLNGKSRKKR
jgi:class 3 adenylate cyclase